MKRFRFTLLAICLLLLWLGWNDLSLLLRNPKPQTIGLEELVRTGPPRDWLHVTGGYQDLTEAISTSGSVDLDAFLVPLKTYLRGALLPGPGRDPRSPHHRPAEDLLLQA